MKILLKVKINLKKTTMAWTKNNFPESMKKLPITVRTKAIEIANAMLKEKIKMKEDVLIATSIKRAREIAGKEVKSVATPETEKVLIENRFHHQEEVAFGQENKKVSEAMATRRNAKRYFRVRGSK
jgi:uncharacterized protein YdaT